MVNLNPNRPLGALRLALGVRAPAHEGADPIYPDTLAEVWFAPDAPDTIIIASTDPSDMDLDALRGVVNDEWQLQPIEVPFDRNQVERVAKELWQRIRAHSVLAEGGVTHDDRGLVISLRCAAPLPDEVTDGLPPGLVDAVVVGPDGMSHPVRA